MAVVLLISAPRQVGHTQACGVVTGVQDHRDRLCQTGLALSKLEWCEVKTARYEYTVNSMCNKICIMVIKTIMPSRRLKQSKKSSCPHLRTLTGVHLPSVRVGCLALALVVYLSFNSFQQGYPCWCAGVIHVTFSVKRISFVLYITSLHLLAS